MLDLAEEVTGKRELPGFSRNVIFDDEISCYLHQLHEMVMNGTSDLGKEENLLFLISNLIQKYGQPFENCVLECPQEIERACDFMRHHYSERIYLDQILSAGYKKTRGKLWQKERGLDDASPLDKSKKSFSKEQLLGLLQGIANRQKGQRKNCT